VSRIRVSTVFRAFVLAVSLVVLSVGGAATPARAQAAPQQAGPQQPGPGVSEQSTPMSAVPEKREQEKDETESFRHSAMVQKMGHALGMSTEQAAVAFEVANFVLLLVGVGFILVKTLPRTFRDRSSAIQRNLVEARTATEEANARLKAVETRLSKLDDEIASMRQQVETDAVREEQRMKAAIEEETAKILASADAEIQAATATARRDLQRHAAELAIDQAVRRLTITAETDRLLIEGFAQRLTGDKGAQN
jgi:F-type H+-transporting ATPase subunit b